MSTIMWNVNVDFSFLLSAVHLIFWNESSRNSAGHCISHQIFYLLLAMLPCRLFSSSQSFSPLSTRQFCTPWPSEKTLSGSISSLQLQAYFKSPYTTQALKDSCLLYNWFIPAKAIMMSPDPIPGCHSLRSQCTESYTQDHNNLLIPVENGLWVIWFYFTSL